MFSKSFLVVGTIRWNRGSAGRGQLLGGRDRDARSFWRRWQSARGGASGGHRLCYASVWRSVEEDHRSRRRKAAGWRSRDYIGARPSGAAKGRMTSVRLCWTVRDDSDSERSDGRRGGRRGRSRHQTYSYFNSHSHTLPAVPPPLSLSRNPTDTARSQLAALSKRLSPNTLKTQQQTSCTLTRLSLSRSFTRRTHVYSLLTHTAKTHTLLQKHTSKIRALIRPSPACRPSCPRSSARGSSSPG